MKRKIILGIIIFSVLIYFIFDLAVLPQEFVNKKQLEPKPILLVTLSSEEITIGESFRLDVISKNDGDRADILLVSVGFPNLEDLKDVVEIVSYDFTQSPNEIIIGEKIGAKYGGGINSVFAKYPSIEAMSRPSPAENQYNIGLKITPKNPGIFDMYVKSFAMPHTSNYSHYPNEGILDHQQEFIKVYSVKVNP